MNNNNELKNITENGNYRLRLCPLKKEKIKKIQVDESNHFLEFRLFFLGEGGLCLTKKYKTNSPGPLAILIGKLTNKFANKISENPSEDDLMNYISEAVNTWADIEMEVTNTEYNGKVYQSYKFISIKPVLNTKENVENVETKVTYISNDKPESGSNPF